MMRLTVHQPKQEDAHRRTCVAHEKGAAVFLEQSVVEHEVEVRQEVIEEVCNALQPAASPGLGSEHAAYIPAQLEGCLFCGHLVTDLDSIAGAIGAAYLYGGTAARASEVNSETAFALERWGVKAPEPIEALTAADPFASICLVDHQQRSQLHECIKQERIVGIIDHHALQSQTIVTTQPIYIDIRPWGSMSTIIAHQFMVLGIKPPAELGGMLLCAILSDTLNLQGPTTTDWDRSMVALLSRLAAVDDIGALAQQQFKAKSKELACLSAHQLVNGDLKEFAVEPEAGGEATRIGFAVIETTDDDIILSRQSELLEELGALRADRGIDALFLAVVHIVDLRSTLLIASAAEQTLAAAAFGGETRDGGCVMDLGKRVSRKKEFVPPLTKAVASGAWIKPPPSAAAPPDSPAKGAAATELFVDPNDPHARVVRRQGWQLLRGASGAQLGGGAETRC